MPSSATEVGGAGRWTDRRLETIVGRLLQVGVLIAAAVVVAGGFLLLVQHGATPVDYRDFRNVTTPLHRLGGIPRLAVTLDSRAIVQLGLVLLIATPVARVALTLIAFMLQRVRLYAVLTAIVLVLLVYGFVGGAV